ncbi:hypothetical protein F5884DRAFT_707336 [Xylogone sp. PMI_703]|nr:hypothetical protein F5884DRAFT_707336 [Xylogone sp. PMI_703]
MSEVGPADRSRLLQSKRAEGSGIVASRKRKLREFFAVCDAEGPLPQVTYLDVDAPPTSAPEAHFLDVCDILQNRLFDEAHLPPRRQLRSDTLKLRSAQQGAAVEPRSADAARKPAKHGRDGSRKGAAATPQDDVDGEVPAVNGDKETATEGATPMQRSTSKGSQTDLPPATAQVLDEIGDKPIDNEDKPEPEPHDESIRSEDLEAERVEKVVESPPGSPGVDPLKVLPVTAEDAANLRQPFLVEGLGSHDVKHKAATVHLPPREVQEERLLQQKNAALEKKEQIGRLTIDPPQQDGEVVSSPESTVDAHSATTPAMHEASTDTSPDNESSRFDHDRLDKDDGPQTPPALRDSADNTRDRDEHDKILKAQMEISRADILGSSPTSAEAQLREEQQAASVAAQRDQPADEEDWESEDKEREAEKEKEDEEDKHEDVQGGTEQLTQEANEVVQDTVEDEDEVVGVPNPEDEPMQDAPELPPHKSPARTEVPDSEGEEQTTSPPEPMDVDRSTTAVKDSDELKPTDEKLPDASAQAFTTAEQPADQSIDESKDVSSKPSVPEPQNSSAGPSSTSPNRSPEKITTRVASGAVKHKSVSEILGEIPQPNTSNLEVRRSDKCLLESDHLQTSTRSTPSSISSTARIRTLAERAKEKERSRLSTVVFAKQPSNALVQSSKSTKETEDYFTPLFYAMASGATRGNQSLDALLQSAHKTITTANAYVPIHENQTAKVLKRIYNLQSSNKWSLRQPKRAPEPNRPTTHWDVLLQEMKWMRTDFREERKWKMTAAKNLAYDCAELVELRARLRDQAELQLSELEVCEIKEALSLLQVNAKPPPNPKAPAAMQGIAMDGAADQDMEPVPEFMPSMESDSPEEDFEEEQNHINLFDTVSPTAIFGLQDNDVVFGLRKTPITDQLLDELPLYGSPLTVPSSELPTSEIDPDRVWRRPALPLSKYVEGRMELKTEVAPRKRSRYDYEDEDDEEDDQVVFGDQGPKRVVLPPEKTDVALFNPENKHIRDRIHAGHQFRPPSEYPMPLQSFFECRTASQWTWACDDELRNLVRDYSYNWSLISSIMSSKSLFQSGYDRRTPWECFERWVHLEGLPNDMQKTHYFRAYTNRLDTAQRNVAAQAAQAPAQPNASGQIQPFNRRRSTIGYRVDRKKNNRHVTLVDAMRKLAKKRETNLQKQQHAAGLAAMRKANEVPQPRAPVHTPQDFSRLKLEKENQMKERIYQMQQRQEAQRKAALLQARNAQNPQQQGLPNGMHQQRGPLPANTMGPNGQPNPAQNLAVAGQNRPRPGMPMPGQVPMNPALQVPQMQMNGIPQMAGMQGRLPVPNPPLDINLVNQARRISEQQRQAVQMQQNQQHPGQSTPMHNSPPNMRLGVLPQPGFVQNMMPPYNPNMPNGVASPSQNGMNVSTPGASASPRVSQSVQQQGPAIPNSMMPHVANLEAQIRQRYPTATAEQVQRMAQDALQRTLHQQRTALSQSAMNAAAGGTPNPAHARVQPPVRVPAGMESSPQLYAQMLSAQQEKQQQQAVANAANANAVSVNGNGTANMGQGQVQVQNRVQSQSPVVGSVPSHGPSQSPIMNQGQVQGQAQTPTPNQIQAQAQAQQPQRSASAGSGK